MQPRSFQRRTTLVKKREARSSNAEWAKGSYNHGTSKRKRVTSAKTATKTTWQGRNRHPQMKHTRGTCTCGARSKAAGLRQSCIFSSLSVRCLAHVVTMTASPARTVPHPMVPHALDFGCTEVQSSRTQFIPEVTECDCFHSWKNLLFSMEKSVKGRTLKSGKEEDCSLSCPAIRTARASPATAWGGPNVTHRP